MTVEVAPRLAVIAEPSDDAVIETDLEGIITRWNPGAERGFGHTAEEAIGRNISILFPSGRMDEESGIDAEIDQGAHARQLQMVGRRKDGSRVDIRLEVSPIKDAQGRVVGMSGMARDITERVRLQERLRRSEEILRITLSSIGDALISTDHEGRVIFMNPVAERLTGWSAQEAVGAPLARAFRIADELTGDAVPDPVSTVRLAGAAVCIGLDAVLASKDGTTRPIEGTAAPIRNARGDMVGVVLVFRDVTERRARTLTAQRLASIVACSSVAIYSISLESHEGIEGTIEIWNRAAELLYGYTEAEIVGKPLTVLVPPALQAEESAVLARLRLGGPGESYESRRLTKAGDVVEVSLSAFPVRDARGRVVAVSKSARDITLRKRMEEAARQREEQFHILADNISQLAWIADDQGSIYWYNKRWYEYTGTTLEAMKGWGWTQVQHPDHVDRVVARIQASWDSGEPWEDIFPLRGKDGGYRWFLSRALPVRDADGHVVRWIGTNTDVTEQHAGEEALRRGALRDSLTDLPNRAYFLERLVQAFEHMRRDPGYRIAVLLLDCDGFKAINDAFGHAAGDRFLQEIASRLRASVRPGDVVARLGGDEFTVLLEAVTGVTDVERAAKHIQDALSAPIALDGRDVVATASIGAVLGDAEHRQPENLLRDADVAMYHAKHHGRARFHLFDAELRDSAQVRSDLEADLRNALTREQLRLVFQPIVELDTGQLRGVEALLRWDRPKRHAVVTPLDLVALADEIGIFAPIGRWVLHESCRYLRSWQGAIANGARVGVSVNISPRHFKDPALVAEVRAALDESGVPPASLSLEIPEQVIAWDLGASRTVIQQLRELGVDLLIDGFGTASSLARMAELPVQGIKLDRALVRQLGARRTEHFAIMRSIVELATALGLRTIATGVETVAQRERLIAFGCELGQGYLLAKPLAPKAAGALVAKAV